MRPHKSIPADAGEPRRSWRWCKMSGVDPRGCGGAHAARQLIPLEEGRSPRMRGSRAQLAQPRLKAGSIPADAGEPTRCGWIWTRTTVDPRGCGGADEQRDLLIRDEGRSPRMRGSPDHELRDPTERGSIPADAGEPTPSRRWRCCKRVDPRGCGGADRRQEEPSEARGRSPRMRGSQNYGAREGARHGSIPADAGEPGDERQGGAAGGVDPRGCGGARSPSAGRVTTSGRSPRMRGSRRGERACAVDLGSIPADAGEPCRGSCASRRRMVDPRGCGGAVMHLDMVAACLCRSPRMRGSRAVGLQIQPHAGSIPADAGEPLPRSMCRFMSCVDPRGCGGAPVQIHYTAPPRGRSPRMRGSPERTPRDLPPAGSIPADAGEPTQRLTSRRCTGVDPRGCGGAERDLLGQVRAGGRSPRMRGSPARLLACGRTRGSIPADAGEPAASLALSATRRVDPRGCGGAATSPLVASIVVGRSPRMRGSPDPTRTAREAAGSIPADAGEPKHTHTRKVHHGVDPRGCGGAFLALLSLFVLMGRSPRMRGSPPRDQRPVVPAGSIPADAGEPDPHGPRRRARRVDPRGCGGACMSQPARWPTTGRSPRMRGSPPSSRPPASMLGSIPADAGEPARRLPAG